MAKNRIKGITIEIGGDTTGLQKSLSKVDSSLRNTRSALSDVNKLLKFNPDSTALYEQKQRLLADAIEDTKDRLETLKKANEEAKRQLESGDLGQDKYDALQREIIETENKLKSLEKTVGSGSAKLAEFSNKAGQMGDKLQNAGKKLMPISAGFTAVGVGIGKVAIDFESAWTDVKKTVDGTEEQFEELRQGILDLSEVTASSATEIAAVASAAGQLGIATPDIMSFTEVMVKLGDTTNLNAEEAASSLAKFANVTQMSAKDYDRLGSVIVDLGNNFATTESDIVSMATRLAATGELAGLSESQIMALATAMSSVGIEAEAGGTAMSKLLKKIQVSVETGSTDLNNFAKVAGMTSEEFKKAFEKDAVSALSAFINGLNDTERNGKTAIAVLDEMGITDVRLSNTILSLANSGDLMTRAIDTANGAWEENNALSKEAKQRYETTESKLKQLKATLVEAGISIGEELLPIIQDLAEGLKNATEKFSKMSPMAKKVTLAIIGIGAGIGPALSSIGKMSQGISVLTGWLSKASTQSGVLKTGSTNLFNVIKAHPYAAAGAAVAGLTALVIEAAKAYDREKNAVQRAYEESEKNIAVVQKENDEIDKTWQKLQELMSVENKSGQQKELMKQYVDQLNESVEGLNLQYDAERDALNKTNDEIQRSIDKRKELAIQQVFEEEINKQYEEWAKKQKEISRLQESIENNEKRIAEARANGAKDTKELEDATEALRGQLQIMQNDSDGWIRNANKLTNESEKLSGSWDDLLKQAGITADQLPKELKQGIDSGRYLIPKSVEELKSYIDFSNLIGEAGEDGAAMVNALQNEILRGDISVTEAVNVLKTSISQKSNEIPIIGKRGGEKFISDLNSGLLSGKVSAKDAVNAVAEYAKKGALSVNFSSIGNDMIAGMIKGVAGQATNLADAVSGVVTGALAKTRKDNKIHSPSRKWEEELGEPLGLGTVEGMLNTLPMFKKTASELTDAALIDVPNTTPLKGRLNINSIENEAMKTPMTNTYNLDNHVTVMIGNEEFNGYIVKTASKGIAQNQKSSMRARGNSYV